MALFSLLFTGTESSEMKVQHRVETKTACRIKRLI